jgi:hypothetical protein
MNDGVKSCDGKLTHSGQITSLDSVSTGRRVCGQT